MYSAWCGMCGMCFLILWQVSDHPTSLWLKVVGEMCSANSSNMISSWSSHLLTIKRRKEVQHSRNWRRTQGIHFPWKEPAAAAWKQLNPFSPRMQLRKMGRVLVEWLQELSTQSMRIRVIGWHTLHPQPDPESLTSLQDKTYLHLLFLLMRMEETPQPVAPKYDLQNLFVMVLSPGFCQGGVGETVYPGVTRSPLDYFCFPAKSSIKLPQRGKTSTLYLHSCPQMKIETCLSPSTQAACWGGSVIFWEIRCQLLQTQAELQGIWQPRIPHDTPRTRRDRGLCSFAAQFPLHRLQVPGHGAVGKAGLGQAGEDTSGLRVRTSLHGKLISCTPSHVCWNVAWTDQSS